MAVPEDGGVALLPIKPEFADAILAGTKRVEFRKAAFRRVVSHVVIYASTPVQRVVGWFRVANVDAGTPADLWSRHEQHGGIAADAYRAYYGDCDSAVAIGVADVTVLCEPIPLSALGVSAPQSFCYLTPKQVGLLNAATARPSRRSRRSTVS
jgi:predicted transcriptional regulator